MKLTSFTILLSFSNRLHKFRLETETSPDAFMLKWAKKDNIYHQPTDNLMALEGQNTNQKRC